MKAKEFRKIGKRIQQRKATYDEECRYSQQWAIRNLSLARKKGLKW